MSIIAETPSAVFRLIAEQTPDIICLHEADEIIRYVTPSAGRLFGAAAREWVGQRLRRFVIPEDVRALEETFEAARAGADPASLLTVCMRLEDGREICLETRVQAVRDNAGQITRFISVMRECPWRGRIEEALRGERLFEGIAEVNRLLLTAHPVRDAMPDFLRVLGEAAGASQAFFGEFRVHSISGRSVLSLRTRWLAETLAEVVESGDIALADPDAADAIATGRLPTEIDGVLENLGFELALRFAVPVRGRALGVIGFASALPGRFWSPAASPALEIVALNIGQAIESEENVAALADSRRRYEALLDGLSEAVFQIDLEGYWRFLNPTWEQLTGVPVEEAMGRRFSIFLAPDEVQNFEDHFNQLVAGRIDRIESEVRFQHRLGREIWLRVAAQPQHDDARRIIGASGTLIDVTHRRRALEAMHASERKFTAVFEASSDALFLLDSATELIVECNPRAVEMFECKDALELIGLNGSSLQLHPLPATDVAAGREVLARGKVWHDEVQYITRRGRVFWGLFSVVVMRPANLGRTLVRITDITDLKDSEERLRASLGEKEVLLKEVYHRVKNNLQIISALLRMQSRRVKDRVAVEALENSISRVMAMSMVHEKLYQAQNLVSIDFLSFAQSLVGFLNQLTIGSQAGISITVEGDPLALSIDQAIPLGLILNEVVTNSLKYAFPDGRPGRVMISIGSHAPGAARIAVADDGVGLAKDADIDEASGLGFRIVRMLVEQLHGELEVESRGGLKVAVRVPPIFRRPHLGV